MATGYNEKLEKIFNQRLTKEIGTFKFDNFKDENGKDILGLIRKLCTYRFTRRRWF